MSYFFHIGYYFKQYKYLVITQNMRPCEKCKVYTRFIDTIIGFCKERNCSVAKEKNSTEFNIANAQDW